MDRLESKRRWLNQLQRSDQYSKAPPSTRIGDNRRKSISTASRLIKEIKSHFAGSYSIQKKVAIHKFIIARAFSRCISLRIDSLSKEPHENL